MEMYHGTVGQRGSVQRAAEQYGRKGGTQETITNRSAIGCRCMAWIDFVETCREHLEWNPTFLKEYKRDFFKSAHFSLFKVDQIFRD
jgi:hypothetical protein